MDGESVTDEPSEDSEKKPLSFTNIFIQLCPQYMVMGMTYEQYWHNGTMMHKAYREAFEIRKKNDEWARWRQGQYNFAALMCAAPVMRAALGKGKVEPGKYPDEPFPMTEKEAQERQEKRERENYKRYIAQMEAASERELKRREEAMKEASMDGND